MAWLERRNERGRPCGGQRGAGGKVDRGKRNYGGKSCLLRLRRALDRGCVEQVLGLCLDCTVWGGALTAVRVGKGERS